MGERFKFKKMKLLPFFLATTVFGKINHCNKCFNQIKPYTDEFNDPIAEMENFVRRKKPKSPKTPKSPPPESAKSPEPPKSPGGEIEEDMMKQCKQMMHEKHHEKVVQKLEKLEAAWPMIKELIEQKTGKDVEKIIKNLEDKFLDGNSIEDIFKAIKEGNISGRDIKKWIKQKWEESDFMNSTEEEQWNKITKIFDAIGIDIESVFNHIESLLGVKIEDILAFIDMLHKPRGEMRFYFPEGMEAKNSADIFQDLISIMPIFTGDAADFDDFGAFDDFAGLIQLGTMFL